MKAVLMLSVGIGLIWWLSSHVFTLPSIGLVHLTWPAATVCVAMFYMVFVLIPWLVRAE